MARTLHENFLIRQEYRLREIRLNRNIIIEHPELEEELEEEILTLYCLMETEKYLDHKRNLSRKHWKEKHEGRLVIYEVREGKHDKKIRDLRFQDYYEIISHMREQTEQLSFRGSGNFYFQIKFY